MYFALITAMDKSIPDDLQKKIIATHQNALNIEVSKIIDARQWLNEIIEEI